MDFCQRYTYIDNRYNFPRKLLTLIIFLVLTNNWFEMRPKEHLIIKFEPAKLESIKKILGTDCRVQ